MSIPIFKKDLAVIQKLSDLPNATDGLTAAELKAKFDEAALEIQKWLNSTLIPALTAANIPFEPSAQLNAQTVQDAIQMVFEQISEASSGTIANGSVTKGKLAQALLERVFGGRVWVSLDKPTANDTPAEDFPVGQMWLRPGFTVENVTGTDWSANGCVVVLSENTVTVTGNKTAAQADATQFLSNIGQDGDRVCVLFSVKDKDSEVTSLTVSLNSGEEESTASTVHTATLAGGALSLRFRAVWPSSSLAGGSYTIENLAVVNIDQILRQTTDCRDMADWGSYLESLLPLGSYVSPRELYIQTNSGVWEQFNHEVFPVNRGGTGVDSLAMGEMLYGSGDNTMEKLTIPESGCLLQFWGGVPQWRNPEDVANTGGYLRSTEITYDGNGEERQIEFPGRVAVLFLKTDDETHIFTQGDKKSDKYKGYYSYGSGSGNSYKDYTAGVTLDGNALVFYTELPELSENATWTDAGAKHFNETGKQYKITAIYG